MNKIVIHWTAGVYNPNESDFQHYHYLVTGDGLIVKGKYPVDANKICKTDSKGNALYAAHCGGGNTGAIGVSMCGMAGFKNSKQVGNYPLKKIQVEACFQLVAKLCKEYKIPITPDTVMTHYEFGMKHPKTSSAGKIDIIYLPPYPDESIGTISNFIRNKIKWYYCKL